MDENLQYAYQIPDLKTGFQIGFGNIIEQIIELLTYSDISADTKTFDNEELNNLKLKLEFLLDQLKHYSLLKLYHYYHTYFQLFL